MKVSILQWNVWYLEDIKNIAEFLKQNHADIICLQELSIDFEKQNYIHTPEYIAKELGYNFYYQDIPFAGQEMRLANGIFSCFPIVDSRTVWINKEQGSGSYDDENRAYIEARIMIDSTELTVGTVHMSYTHRFEASHRKMEETTKLVEAIRDNHSNFVLTGDFNATPESAVIESVLQHFKDCGPDYDAKTWTIKPFSYDGFETSSLDWRLDYIFGSKDIAVTNSKIIETAYSDHLPVMVEVSL